MKPQFASFFLFLTISYSAHAQTWLGSTDTNGLLYRDGNVLIGSTSFSGSYQSTERILQLQGAATYLSMISTTNGGSFNLSYSGTYGTGLYSRGAQISFWTSPTVSGAIAERMRIGGDGNIGIGTTTPSSMLNVFEGDVRINATTANRYLILDALSSANLATMISLKRSNVSRWLFGANGNSGTDDFEFARYSDTGAFLGGVVRFQRTTGNAFFQNTVGIGPETSLPGFASLYLSKGSGLNPSIMFQNTDAAVDNRVWSVMAQGGRFRILSQPDNYAGAQDAFIIHRNALNITVTSFPNGNVGIGTIMTNNPNSYKLAVNGKIGAKEVQVENTSSTWADYVFEPDYKLRSLEEIENFIKVNKHLPEIPSQKDIEENGHKLGEMDVLLLKKVEELTLYMIELNNEIGIQKKRNVELTKRIMQLEKEK